MQKSPHPAWTPSPQAFRSLHSSLPLSAPSSQVTHPSGGKCSTQALPETRTAWPSPSSLTSSLFARHRLHHSHPSSHFSKIIKPHPKISFRGPNPPVSSAQQSARPRVAPQSSAPRPNLTDAIARRPAIKIVAASVPPNSIHRFSSPAAFSTLLPTLLGTTSSLNKSCSTRRHRRG